MMFKIKPGVTYKFTADEVVENFLKTNKFWFEDKSNALYNKRRKAKNLLMYWLLHGEEPPRYVPPELVYVLSKFESEWITMFDKTE